jgi:hypothetical protein
MKVGENHLIDFRLKCSIGGQYLKNTLSGRTVWGSFEENTIKNPIIQ